MQRLFLVLFACSTLLLTGCSFESFQQFFQQTVDTVVRQDQLHEQGFTLDTVSLYQSFDLARHHIDLSDKGLIAIPDICALIQEDDAPDVWSLDLSNNSIRIINADLSCLTYLRDLDLSHNKIKAIYTLGDLPALRELNMEHNELVTTEDFPELPLLEKLNLAFNNIKEIKDIDHLKHLLELDIQHNAIEYMVGVERLEKLEALKLDYAKIASGDLSPLIEKLEGLEIIDQLGNSIGESLRDKLMNNLPF